MKTFQQFKNEYLETLTEKEREEFEAGYQEFKLNVILSTMRKEAGLTQDELAEKLNTKRTAISRWENHAQNITLGVLGKYASACGEKISLKIGDNLIPIT